MGRWVAWAGTIAAVVSCIAAVLVVPEVRCQLGLDVPDGARCVPWRPLRAKGQTLEGVGRGGDADVQQQILLVRSLYQRIEGDQHAGRMEVERKTVTGIGGDSSAALIFRQGGQVAKIQAWVYAGARQTSMEVFYEGSQPRFVYRRVFRDARTIEEQRYYFAGGQMFLWLDAHHDAVPSGSDRFRSRGPEVAQFAATLLAGSAAPDDVIRF